jgi:hypothetical protein
MKMTLLKGLSVLIVNLTISSCKLNPYAIDYKNAELVRKKDGKVERISCYSEKLKEYACFERKDLNRINKCIRRSGK